MSISEEQYGWLNYKSFMHINYKHRTILPIEIIHTVEALVCLKSWFYVNVYIKVQIKRKVFFRLVLNMRIHDSAIAGNKHCLVPPILFPRMAVFRSAHQTLSRKSSLRMAAGVELSRHWNSSASHAWEEDYETDVQKPYIYMWWE